MIGDRYLTDVVYGNRNGLFTVRPAPLTLEGEPSAVLFVSCACTLVSSVPLVLKCAELTRVRCMCMSPLVA